MLPPLNELLTYSNPHLLARYKKEFPDNSLSAEQALTELLKYFWLCEKHRQDREANPTDEELNFHCAIHAEMHEIDDMWHTFLLFTKDYTDFGHKYFGKFLHHVPEVSEEKPSDAEYETDLSRYLSYAYDQLGEETIRTWFKEAL